jgi:DNA-binding CsgD family transcriptional regulator
MVRLQSSDFEALLAFVGDVAGLEFDKPYPVGVVACMQDLVHCDDITYQDLDLNAQRFYAVVGPDDEVDDPDDVDELYWRVGPCPISDYRTRTGDLRTVTMSDLIDQRRYHDLPIFREYFRPAGLDNMIDLGLPAVLPRQRSFILFREAGAGDFSERDRAVLEMLRPHLYRLEAYAALRRQLSEALRAQEDSAEPDPYAELTSREREIVELVAEGKTNAQIAVQLWIAPCTVKKHLEHIYSKLGVGRRTAAATLQRSAR